MATDVPPFDYPGLNTYIGALENWVFPEIRRAYDAAILPDGKWRLFLGVIVYGRYVDRFLDLCVPTLLAPGNVPALSEPTILIHTDRASLPKLKSGVMRLSEVAKVEIHIIPDQIIAMVGENPSNKYWLLGAAHNLHMMQAKYRAHAYHMLMPDHVYSERYFVNLARLAREHHALVQCNISASMEAVTDTLTMCDGRIDSRELNALALDNMHQQVTPYVMNGKEGYPTNLLLVMVGKDAVHIVSPHMSIVYLSHSVLMRAPLRLFNTVDGQLPFFIPEDVEPYVPMPDDDMSYMEVSDAQKPYNPADSCSLAEFAARFWIAAYCHKGFLRYLGLSTIAALPAGYVPPIKPMADDEIDALHERVYAGVVNSFDMIYAAAPEERRIDPILRLEAA